MTELNFPAITVCRQGLDMAAVQRAMELDYEYQAARQGTSESMDNMDMDTYLHEMYICLDPECKLIPFLMQVFL